MATIKELKNQDEGTVKEQIVRDLLGTDEPSSASHWIWDLAEKLFDAGYRKVE